MGASLTALRVVVMGISGAGKSTVGLALAHKLGADFCDGDDLHSAANRTTMAAGVPLTDAQRSPWLDDVAAWLAGQAGDAVVACSALKRAHRDRIRGAAPDSYFVHLHGDPALLAQRQSVRRGHFMPASLMASQLAALEPLGADEAGVRLDVAADLSTLVERALTALGEQG